MIQLNSGVAHTSISYNVCHVYSVLQDIVTVYGSML